MTLFKTQNKKWDEEFNSTKLLMYADNLVKFKVTYHRFTGKTPNPNENIQRVKSTNMEEHFNTLESSELNFDTTLYNDLAKALVQKCLVVNFF